MPLGPKRTVAGFTAGEKQAELFEAEGVSPARVSLGRSDDTDDMDYLRGLAMRGYTLGMDHTFWGRAPGATLPWQERAGCIKQVIDDDFVDRIFLSNDSVRGDVEREKSQPGWYAVYDSQDDSLSETNRRIATEIQRITVENPKRFFSRCEAVGHSSVKADSVPIADDKDEVWS